jgi:hypothetical protein
VGLYETEPATKIGHDWPKDVHKVVHSRMHQRMHPKQARLPDTTLPRLKTPSFVAHEFAHRNARAKC